MMAGLLDSFDDPGTQGLLSLGLRLMSAPGRFGQALGSAGMGALSDMASARDAIEKRKMQEQQMQSQALAMQMHQAQLADMQRQAADRERQAAFLRSLPSPQMVASQAALAGGGGPTVANAAKMPQIDPGMSLVYQLAQQGLMPTAELAKLIHKDTTPKTLKKGEAAFSADFKTKIAENPDTETSPELVKLIAARDALPPGHPDRKVLDQAIMTKSTHTPPINVTYGAPVAGVDANGRPIFFQPGKDDKTPPKILTGVAPPSKEMPAGMAEKFATNAVTLQKIDKAIKLTEQLPEAFGLQNLAPDAIVQRFDPKGAQVRAMVADIGGQKIHDRSGAAVTVGESERLKPYIPAATDKPDVAAMKLRLFRDEYLAMQKALASGASIKDAAQKADSSAGDWGIKKIGGE